jgi:hypothetical protein
MYVIVKKIKSKKGVEIPVIILDPGTQEILEFETKEEAERIKELFMVNSNHGYEYEIKKL